MDKFESVDILLVEDSPADAELALRALRKGKLANHITWVKDGAEALEFIFRNGAYAGRPEQNPKLIAAEGGRPRGIEAHQGG
jgi:CheY-like chemotaxis protein